MFSGRREFDKRFGCNLKKGSGRFRRLLGLEGNAAVMGLIGQGLCMGLRYLGLLLLLAPSHFGKLLQGVNPEGIRLNGLSLLCLFAFGREYSRQC